MCPLYVFQEVLKIIENIVKLLNPDVINIDYEVDPKKIKEEINITVFKVGLDPKILLNRSRKFKKTSS